MYDLFYTPGFTPYRHNYTVRFYNKIAATLVFRTNPVGVELFPL